MNTAEKRFSAMQMGRPFVVALHPPSGSSTPFSRFMSLAVYYLAPPLFGDPFDGWSVAGRPVTWAVDFSSRVWSAGRAMVVWKVER
jgi:hypothetical protein